MLRQTPVTNAIYDVLDVPSADSWRALVPLLDAWPDPEEKRLKVIPYIANVVAEFWPSGVARAAPEHWLALDVADPMRSALLGLTNGVATEAAPVAVVAPESPPHVLGPAVAEQPAAPATREALAECWSARPTPAVWRRLQAVLDAWPSETELLDQIIPDAEARLAAWPSHLLRPTHPRWLDRHDRGEPVGVALHRLVHAPGGYWLCHEVRSKKHSQQRALTVVERIGAVCRSFLKEAEARCVSYAAAKQVLLDSRFTVRVCRFGVVAGPELDLGPSLEVELSEHRDAPSQTYTLAEVSGDRRAEVEELLAFRAANDPAHQAAETLLKPENRDRYDAALDRQDTWPYLRDPRPRLRMPDLVFRGLPGPLADPDGTVPTFHRFEGLRTRR